VTCRIWVRPSATSIARAPLSTPAFCTAASTSPNGVRRRSCRRPRADNSVLKQGLRRHASPCKEQCLAERPDLRRAQHHLGASLTPPGPVERREYLWLRFNEALLLLGRQLDHAPFFLGT